MLDGILDFFDIFVGPQSFGKPSGGGGSGASAGLVELTGWLGLQEVLQGRAQGVRALAVEIPHQPHQQQYSHTTSPIHIFAVMCNN